jgi:hypothetical protein
VTFSAAEVSGDSSATGVGCTRAQNYDYQYHFTVDTLRFHDPLPGLDTLCGDLAFNGRVRHDTVWYTGVQDSAGGESPWVYWWRRSRDRESGTTDTVNQITRDSVPPLTHARVKIEMPLDDRYDGLGVVAVYSDDSTLTPTDSAFFGDQGIASHVNVWIQHWRHIEPPILDSVTQSGHNVTLYWRNQHQDRSIDRTNVYHNDDRIATLDHAATSFPDSNLAQGQYTYRLKHVSIPLTQGGEVGLVPPSSPGSNKLEVTVGPSPTACATAEYLHTWERADQYLSAGCSELGANKRFRWYDTTGTPLTGWSTDTLFDFPGHSAVGSPMVVLEDSNTTTYETSRDTLMFTVSTGQVVVSGPDYVTDKKVKTYAATAGGSPHAGQWFERYDDGPTWYPATAYEQTSMTRIWPAGQYTVDLRQHKVQGTWQRGRLAIEVCYQCGPLAPLAGAAGGSSRGPRASSGSRTCGRWRSPCAALRRDPTCSGSRWIPIWAPTRRTTSRATTRGGAWRW